MSSARFLSSASVSSCPRAARKNAGRGFARTALSATSAGISFRWRAASSMKASFFSPASRKNAASRSSVLTSPGGGLMPRSTLLQLLGSSPACSQKSRRVRRRSSRSFLTVSLNIFLYLSCGKRLPHVSICVNGRHNEPRQGVSRASCNGRKANGQKRNASEQKRVGHMSLRRFTSVKNLSGLGRPLLGRFFERFNSQLQAKSVVLPAETLEDADYFEALAQVFRAPDALPDEMLEALEEIAEIGNGAGVERLQKAVAGQPS